MGNWLNFASTPSHLLLLAGCMCSSGLVKCSHSREDLQPNHVRSPQGLLPVCKKASAGSTLHLCRIY